MNNIIEFLGDIFGIAPETQKKIFFSILILLLLSLLRIVILRIVWKNTENIDTRYFWRRIVSYTVPITAIFLIGMVWIDAFRHLGAFLGLVSAGIAIALKDLIANIAGWLFIMFRKPFGIGDRIQIGENRGDVIDLRLYQFTILEIGNWVDADQSTGRVIHIPNGKIFTEPQANYNQGFRYLWNEISLRLTFDSDWQKAKVLFDQIIQKHASSMTESAESGLIEASKMYLIHYQHFTPIVYTSVVEDGIKLTGRYLCEPRSRRTSEAAIWEDILTKFEEHYDIKWAYPTQRLVSYKGSFFPNEKSEEEKSEKNSR